jgi:hypothetical protein
MRLRKLSTHSRKAFEVPHSEKTWFQQGLHSTHSMECSWYWSYYWPTWWEGKEYVIAYASRSNNKAKSNYFSYEGECLIVVWVIIHFRPYLYGTNFILYTDHQPIKWLMTNNKLNGKLARWALILQEYEFKVIHRPSITHQNTDTMSQRPFTTFEDFLKIKQNFN